ncbi:E3 Ubiquitin-Protein Ligase Praja-1 [Manis pentadactyla]|nr:E3 Ubiquitin-Protein Ligase Praja-1 [Manis pentadactyla]
MPVHEETLGSRSGEPSWSPGVHSNAICRKGRGEQVQGLPEADRSVQRSVKLHPKRVFPAQGAGHDICPGSSEFLPLHLPFGEHLSILLSLSTC